MIEKKATESKEIAVVSNGLLQGPLQPTQHCLLGVLNKGEHLRQFSFCPISPAIKMSVMSIPHTLPEAQAESSNTMVLHRMFVPKVLSKSDASIVSALYLLLR